MRDGTGEARDKVRVKQHNKPCDYDWDAIQETAAAIRAIDGRRPDVAVVLGSGLGAFGESLDEAKEIPYGDLPHFPEPSVSGHDGSLVVGTLEGRVVATLKGRVHGYEGWDPQIVVFPVRVMRALGARVLVITNAAGALHAGLAPGDLMALTDHINLTAATPLRGPNDDRIGPRFPDMSRPYDPALRAVVEAEAAKLGIPLRKGVYVGVTGPSYETAAEVRMLRSAGGDAVGMSTVLEVIAAVHAGFRVCGMSCVTNHTAGIAKNPLTHEEVKEVAEKARGAFTALLKGAIPRFPLT